MKIYVNEQTKELIQKKYEELKKSGEEEGFLDEETLGGVKLFINQKPKYYTSELVIGDDDVYIGSEDLISETN